MDFRILGPLELSEDGRPVAVGVPKQRALLAALLLNANDVVSRDRLVDELWGERPPARAAKLIQHYVSGLRKVLPEGVLATKPPGYVLRVEPGQLDLIEFERLLEDARRAVATGEQRRAAHLYPLALSLWRGRALEDVALEGMGAPEAERLNDLRLVALHERVDLELALGRHADLVGELEALVRAHPFQERFLAQLMLALYRDGRQAEALEAFRDARRLLRDELGLEPNPKLQELERAILRHEPALDPVAAGPEPEAAQPRRRMTVAVVAAVLSEPPSDPEALDAAAERTAAILDGGARSHGGTAERLPGGDVLAWFGVAGRREDDALRAARTAMAARQSLGGSVRLGVAVGEVVTDGTTVTGEPMRAASRLAAEAPPGEVLATAGAVAVAGRALTVSREGDSFRILGVTSDAPALPAPPETPLVGRDAELRRLGSFLAAAVERRCCRAALVVGEAGIGKTRLAREFAAALGDGATVLVARCSEQSTGSPYLPLGEALAGIDVERALAGLDGAELIARRVAEMRDAQAVTASVTESFWALRRTVEALAAERPLVLVVEDAHSADQTLLELVESLVEWSTGSPSLVLCLGRPEILQTRPTWGGPSSPVASLALGPLTPAQGRRLVDAAAAGLTEETRARIVEAAEGNPLYAEQLAIVAADEGEDEAADVPPSIAALITGRIDRLPAAERAILERASVVGRTFSHAAVAQLTPPDEAAGLGARLVELARRGIVRTSPSERPGQERLEFHHALLREVAYAATPKTTRAALHEQHGDWLDLQGAGDAIVGYHLERASLLRHDLDPDDGQAHRLAIDAGRRLGAAGLRAWMTGDVPATLDLLGRATVLLGDEEADGREFQTELGVARWAAGEPDRARDALRHVLEISASRHDRRTELRAGIELEALELFTSDDGSPDAFLASAARATTVQKEIGDLRGLASTRFLTAFVQGALQCRYAESETAARHALDEYRRAGWPLGPAACLELLAAAHYYGPTPVGEGVASCEGLLRRADRLGEAHVLAFLAGLHAMLGSFEQGRELVAASVGRYEELGLPRSAAMNAVPVAAHLELLAGDPEAAERIYRDGCGTLERMGEPVALSTLAGRLAHLVALYGRVEEAAAWASRAEALARPGDLSAQLAWRTARMLVLVRTGNGGQAREVAGEAISLLSRTDALNDVAQCLVAAAEVSRATGDGEEARRRLRAARDALRRKENVVAAAQVDEAPALAGHIV